jgi:hypothetical protein
MVMNRVPVFAAVAIVACGSPPTPVPSDCLRWRRVGATSLLAAPTGDYDRERDHAAAGGFIHPEVRRRPS